MRPQPVLALVADTLGSRRSSDDTSARVQRAALAVQRAVLVRGGRVLICADGVALVPLLLAAAEFQTPRRVEGDERPTAALIVAPFPSGDFLEDRLIRFKEDRGEGVPPLTLLQQLVASGLADLRHEVKGGADPAEAFSMALRELDVSGVFAVGGDDRARPLLEAAEAYHALAQNVRVSLVQLLHSHERARWPDLAESIGEFSRSAPVFEGGTLREHPKDERLVMIGLQAAEEAALALAIDRAVEQVIMEEPEAGSQPGTVLA